MLGFNDLSTPLKAVIALAFVLILVVIAGLLLRRIAGGRLPLQGQGGRARQPRLGVVDVFALDRQRQLVLLRRDNVEHLVMIGGPNDVVIEAAIIRSQTRSTSQAAPAIPETDVAALRVQTAPPQLRAARAEAVRHDMPHGDPALAEASEPRAGASVGVLAGVAAAGAAAIAARQLSDPAPSTPAASPVQGPTETPDTGETRSAPPPDLPTETRRLPDFLRQDVRAQAGSITAPAAPMPSAVEEPQPAAPIDSADDTAAAIALTDRLAAELGAELSAELSATVGPPDAPVAAAASEAAADRAQPRVEGESGGALQPARPDAAEKLARELQVMLGASPQPLTSPHPPAAPEAASDDQPSPAAGIDPIDLAAELARALQISTEDEPAAEAKAEDAAAISETSAPAEPAGEPDKAAGPAADATDLSNGNPAASGTADITPPPASGDRPPALPPSSSPAAATAKPEQDPFSVEAIEAEFARLLNRPISR